MEYIHTRRVGDMVWVHTADFFAPNIHQFPPTWEDVKEEKVFQRPQATDWTVPIDDTNTMKMRFTYVNENEPRTLAPTRFGQEADRSYEERQRKPGDYDVAVSQRPIAVHALEHLGATDRGIIMLRKLVRDGIRAMENGEDPLGIVRQRGKVIPTFSQDTIIRIPPAPNPAQDEELLRETGRKVLADCLRQYGPRSPFAQSTPESSATVG